MVPHLQVVRSWGTTGIPVDLDVSRDFFFQSSFLLKKVLHKEVELGDPTSFLDHVYLGCNQTHCETRKHIVDHYSITLEPKFPQEKRRNYHAWKPRTFLHGPATWKVMPQSVWNDIANWRTQPLNNCTRYLLPASMTTNSKKKK